MLSSTSPPELDTELDMSLDFAPVLPCEGQNHKAGLLGHVAANPAAFRLVHDCGTRLLVCAPRAAALRFVGIAHCQPCDRDYPVRPANLIPIDGSA